MNINSHIQEEKNKFKTPLVFVPVVGLIVFFLTFSIVLFLKIGSLSSYRTLFLACLFYAWLAGSLSVAVLSWFGAARNFFLVINSGNASVFLKNVNPLNYLYVFSDAYLNEEGKLAKSRLKQYLLLFLVAMVLGGVLAISVSNISI